MSSRSARRSPVSGSSDTAAAAAAASVGEPCSCGPSAARHASRCDAKAATVLMGGVRSVEAAPHGPPVVGRLRSTERWAAFADRRTGEPPRKTPSARLAPNVEMPATPTGASGVG
eukprot:6318450-Prymnesium_polylepis.1